MNEKKFSITIAGVEYIYTWNYLNVMTIWKLFPIRRIKLL